MVSLRVPTPGNFPVAKNWCVVSIPFQMAKLWSIPASRLVTLIEMGWPGRTARQFVFHEMFFAVICNLLPLEGGHLILRIVCLSTLTQARKSGSVTTLMTNVILACPRPQNSAHCPLNVPSRVGVQVKSLGNPGIALRMKKNAGTKNSCMTSFETR